ncbi:DUF2937 family protein [Aeromonas bivalvium]|uniref:DUF2937 family protein n=1 Tax=Aeromonas bivalvium TaxID=440079 RepID=UPI0038CFF1AF
MRSYLRMVLFALGLLAGVQLPGLLDLYFQRIDARLQQAELSLSPFRANAERHFAGDLGALLGHYQQSQDPVVRGDAEGIRQLIEQQRMLRQEQALAAAPWYRQALHLLGGANRDLVGDTLAHYGYVVPLKQEAIVCGLLAGVLGALLGDLLWALLAWPFRAAPRRRGELR